MLTFVKVMGIPFLSTKMNTLVDLLEQRMGQKKKTFLVTANPEIVMQTQKDDGYCKKVESANYVIPDGVGILLGAKIMGTPIPNRLAGFDLMLELFQLSAQKGYKIYLLGAEEDVLEDAVRLSIDKYPGIQIVGYRHGFCNVDDPALVEDMKACEPDMIFVGLGCPKQEDWIDQHLEQFDKGLFIGVGGSFDVLAGRVKRAPMFWQRLKLEWLYRLIQRPSRWRRMMAIPHFVLKIIKQRYLNRKNAPEQL